MTTNEPARYWDEQASRFDDAPDHGLRDPGVRDAWRRLLVGLLPEPPAYVLDLGCGTGSLSVLVALEGHAVTGLDLSPEMLAVARVKATAASVVVDFRLDDAGDPAVDPVSVDVVLVRHLVWALADPDQAIRRWAGLLRPAGRLLVIEGRWSNGVGLTARQLEPIVRGVVADVEVRPLPDEQLWGGPTHDERFVVIART